MLLLLLYITTARRHPPVNRAGSTLTTAEPEDGSDTDPPPARLCTGNAAAPLHDSRKHSIIKPWLLNVLSYSEIHDYVSLTATAAVIATVTAAGASVHAVCYTATILLLCYCSTPMYCVAVLATHLNTNVT